MKLQGLSVVFTLICIPLLLVLSYYISLQVDTITLQNQYDTKLLDATYDALSAFELNTANEDLSTVSDSLRTIIEASNNIFFNTLATNMGLSNASRAYIDPYIPAILYTLYDGYYIYAPTSSPIVATTASGTAISVGDDGVLVSGTGGYTYSGERLADGRFRFSPSGDATVSMDDYVDPVEDYGQLLYRRDDNDVPVHSGHYQNPLDPTNQVSYDYVEYNNLTTDIAQAETEVKSVLKSYMPYSARYRNFSDSTGGTGNVFGAGNVHFDITAIYTLDNYLSIEGFIQTDRVFEQPARVYYSESGYLLKNAENIDIDLTIRKEGSPDTTPDILTYNQDDIELLIDNMVDDAASSSIVVTITDPSDASKNTQIASSEVMRVETLIENFGNAYIPEDPAVEGRVRLHELTEESDRWNEKTQKEKYEVLMTILKNRQKDFEDEAATNVAASNAHLVQLNPLINRAQYNMDIMSSLVYYAKAKIFTNWVTTHLSMVKAKDIVEISGIEYSTLQQGLYRKGRIDSTSNDFENVVNLQDVDVPIFDAAHLNDGDDNGSITEINEDSTYYDHKLRVIRESIQYNLNLAMSTYNSNEAYRIGEDEVRKIDATGTSSKSFEYAMPALQSAEWEKITENPSIIAFMQGMRCGLKVYNNYALVSSVNNELIVRPEQIYYVPYDAGFTTFNDGVNPDEPTTYYHKIDCEELSSTANAYASFSSKEVKYDKLYDKTARARFYKYDHRNLACYYCINDGNYRRDWDKIPVPGGHDIRNIFEIPQRRKAFYVAAGKERNNIYKMNAFSTSNGYQVIFSNGSGTLVQGYNSRLGLSNIRAIRIVFSYVSGEGSENLNFRVTHGIGDAAPPYSDTIYSIPANSPQLYTIEVKLDRDMGSVSNERISKGIIGFQVVDEPDDTLRATKQTNLRRGIEYVEVLYK